MLNGELMKHGSESTLHVPDTGSIRVALILVACNLQPFSTYYSRISLIRSFKLRTPSLHGHHLENCLGSRGCHIACAYSKVVAA